jgi:demethylmenaquinone methyltransferase/2-methoxy-6-polyprenyl-1,4-benzoquinol methylase
MYETKKKYFDKNVNSRWASAEYTHDEMAKLNRLFEHTGPLTGLKILEPGCGTGRLTEILSDRTGEKGSVISLDISPMMIDAAMHRNASKRNVKVHLGPVERFHLEEGSFDFIICHQVFPHFENKKAVLSLFKKALKPEGRLIVIHFIGIEEINDMHRKAGTEVEGDMMPEKNEIMCLFDNAGFTIEFIQDDHLGYFLSSVVK